MKKSPNYYSLNDLLIEMFHRHENAGSIGLDHKLKLKEAQKDLVVMTHQREFECSDKVKDMIDDLNSLASAIYRLRVHWASPEYLYNYNGDQRRIIIGTPSTGFCLALVDSPVHTKEILKAADRAIKREKGSARNRKNLGETAAQNMIMPKNAEWYLRFGTDQEIANIRTRYKRGDTGFLPHYNS